jgi:two-component system, chemotaxis family, chemotaxis protein CheY
MNGLEVLTRLREMDPRARVLIASADIQDMTLVLIKEAGAAGFIGKPFVAEVVLEKIAAALKGTTP